MSTSEVHPCNHEGSFREASPMHFLFKIQSFSVLSESSVKKFESNEFIAGGYKWKLLLYPNGNENENGNGHISLYLVLSDSSSLSAGWELNVFFKLFLFDQIRDRYLLREETGARTTRFHELKMMQGFPQFVTLANFSNPSNGYLVDDTCAFGAEVFVFNPASNVECLSMIKETTLVKHTWKIEHFSKIEEESVESEKFKAGEYYWKLEVYPNGYSTAKNNYVSVFLYLADCEENLTGHKVYANYRFVLKDQINGKHTEYNFEDRWFSSSTDCWGWWEFMEIGEINDESNGFLVNDTCIVEVEVEVLGVSLDLP